MKGGKAPWVYSDASHGVKEYGEFEINNAQIIYDHSAAIARKKEELHTEAFKYNVAIYQKGLFFSVSKFATPKYPYGPFADHFCYPLDPITQIADECTILEAANLKFKPSII